MKKIAETPFFYLRLYVIIKILWEYIAPFMK